MESATLTVSPAFYDPLLKTETATLTVCSAFSDPPFEVEIKGVSRGLDLELIGTVCNFIGVKYKLVKYRGDNFNEIFYGLYTGEYDIVISGTTITAEREKIALFSDPYLEFGQGLVVNRNKNPDIKSVNDLRDQTVGIQFGNTSDIVARELKKTCKIRDIKYYPYGDVSTILDDLNSGTIGAFIKLYPVSMCLIEDHHDLSVIQEIPTHEKLGIAVALGNITLKEKINKALSYCRNVGIINSLASRWLCKAECNEQSVNNNIITGMRVVYIYTGEDGHSHFIEDTIFSPHIAHARFVSFEETTAGSCSLWHNAPTYQYVITLNGTVEFETRGSWEKRVINKGDVILAADVDGDGHKWNIIGDQPWRRLYVTI